MRKILILLAAASIMTSCKWGYQDNGDPYLPVSDSKSISTTIGTSIIADAKMYKDVIWSYHPYIKSCFYNADKEVYLYKRDSIMMLVDYKNNVVHDFNKHESMLLSVAIETFEQTMHQVELGKVKNHITSK